jgi:myo-inositol 2-dehydrogenase / D-chiro-inositol 1-dehydrogenase
MTVRIGVIGVGMIGQDHIRRLSRVVAGAQVVALTDVDPAKAQEVATQFGTGTPIRVHVTGQDVVSDPEVDAVVVCSWGPTHEEYVLAAIGAGKPVFCEKPLAETQEACLRILAAEVAFGRRLVQVGYMRRYDAGYRALKEVVDSGAIGAPLIVHCAHRNPSVPGHYTKDMAITDTAVHEIDTMRWLLGEEIVGTQVLTPRRSRHGDGLQDPLILLFELESGAIVDVEVSVNIRYGYDIRSEVVGEDGTAALGDASAVVVRREGGISSPVPTDWRERFIRAYDIEFQEWIDSIAGTGLPTSRIDQGASAWDGYAAAAVSNAALEALHSGTKTSVKLADKPELYR